MYARNITAFLLNLVKDGKLQFNEADEIHRETLNFLAGTANDDSGL